MQQIQLGPQEQHRPTEGAAARAIRCNRQDKSVVFSLDHTCTFEGACEQLLAQRTFLWMYDSVLQLYLLFFVGRQGVCAVQKPGTFLTDH